MAVFTSCSKPTETLQHECFARVGVSLFTFPIVTSSYQAYFFKMKSPLFLQKRKTCQIGKPRSSSSSWRQFFLFLKSIDHLITLVSLMLTNNVILFLNPQDPKGESQTVTWTLILAWQFFQLLVDASTLLASINYGYKVNSSELNWSEYDLLDVPINGNDLNLTQLTSASFIDVIKKRLWKG